MITELSMNYERRSTDDIRCPESRLDNGCVLCGIANGCSKKSSAGACCNADNIEAWMNFITWIGLNK